MSQITTEPVAQQPRHPDDEFLRRAGIVPDLQPRASTGLKVFLAFALLLAGATSVAAGMFAAGAPAGSPGYQACATSCPGMARSALP